MAVIQTLDTGNEEEEEEEGEGRKGEKDRHISKEDKYPMKTC